MPSATADTNIYISALQFGGTPQRFLDGAAAGDFRLDISDAIFREILRVLHDKFGWPESELREAEMLLSICTRRVVPTQILDVIKADPSDNRILECATAAGSEVIVTGDKQHILPLGVYQGIPIVTVADFMRGLKTSSPRG